jgi:hypothetical protein
MVAQGQFVAPEFVCQFKQPFSSKAGAQETGVLRVFLTVSSQPIVGVFKAQWVSHTFAVSCDTAGLFPLKAKIDVDGMKRILDGDSG